MPLEGQYFPWQMPIQFGGVCKTHPVAFSRDFVTSAGCEGTDSIICCYMKDLQVLLALLQIWLHNFSHTSELCFLFVFSLSKIQNFVPQDDAKLNLSFLFFGLNPGFTNGAGVGRLKFTNFLNSEIDSLMVYGYDTGRSLCSWHLEISCLQLRLKDLFCHPSMLNNCLKSQTLR